MMGKEVSGSGGSVLFLKLVKKMDLVNFKLKLRIPFHFVLF